MAHHRVLLPNAADVKPGDTLLLEGEEAHHAARVKRLGPGDRVELLSGAGRTATASVRAVAKLRSGGWSLELAVEAVRDEPPVRPAVHVVAAAPKSDRVEQMIDQLSQVGAASWSPLLVTRTVVDPRPTKLDRLARVALESAKQCGRAWALTIGPAVTLTEALEADPGTRIVAAHQSGARFEPDGSERLRLLVGPEGGFADAELDLARDAGATIARFGPYTMRIETAAVVACALILPRI
jgi:16S rRNA (uracil1498-N3)-methyltransferase